MRLQCKVLSTPLLKLKSKLLRWGNVGMGRSCVTRVVRTDTPTISQVESRREAETTSNAHSARNAAPGGAGGGNTLCDHHGSGDHAARSDADEPVGPARVADYALEMSGRLLESLAVLRLGRAGIEGGWKEAWIGTYGSESISCMTC